MDIQLLVVLILFGAALFFIGRRIYRQFDGKKQAGCEKCGANESSSAKISGK
ncbi:MAG: FeoB-associated Cys-rich membrane protein [Bacteroidetes bacterium]|nr:FeoB-associated Cys-rich membrane protein [Bacteroidota bacterium]MBK6839465.1 FeoB-associated Cys-rich membrane protein [Bacteroidota bacterium]MBK9525963.1 FeoB-associated Cys-rich membrane protein [Bacteroidota bacterium]MBK9542565.1 FeoB-associated Cys-rich membrane protein [Bacteroidota bacterium]MBL0256920.1 FeoB-associated Cys-rich membrane protein [Bacteroidota bacterium]